MFSTDDNERSISATEFNDLVRRRFVFAFSFLLITTLVVILIVATIAFRPSIYSLASSSSSDSTDYHVPEGMRVSLNPSFGNSELFELDDRIRDVEEGIEHPTIRSAFSAFHEILEKYRTQFERGAAGDAFKFEIETLALPGESGFNWKLADHLDALDKVVEIATEYLRPGMEEGAREALELLISTANLVKKLHGESDQPRNFIVVSTSED